MKLALGLFLAGHPRQPREPFAYVTEEELVEGLTSAGFSPSDSKRAVAAWVKALDYVARRS